MNKLIRIAQFLRTEKQQLEFIDTCYKKGLCTSEEALDKTIALLTENREIWINILNEPEKVQAYQSQNYN